MSSHEVTCLSDPNNDVDGECYAELPNHCSDVQIVEGRPKVAIMAMKRSKHEFRHGVSSDNYGFQ